MKRMVTLLLVVLLLVPVVALAEVNLTGMSYEELVALKDQINLAIWDSEEWQEVSVPAGVYQVGADIPEGKWTITAADGLYASVKWGDVLDESGVDIDFMGKIYEYETVYSPTYRNYTEGEDRTEVTFDLKEEQYIIVDSGTVVFSPYSGKPELGFK